MPNPDALIVFILDKSGSMADVTAETIDGFNHFVEEQVAQPGKTWLSLALFDTVTDLRFTGANATQVPPLAASGLNHYQPSGGTALYNAVCDAIDAADTWIADNAFAGRVFCVILTDGEENASHDHEPRRDLDDVNDRIKVHADQGWEFVFLGSGRAAWTEGRKLAISPLTTLNYSGTKAATAGTYTAMSSAVTMSRAGGQSLNAVFGQTTAHLNADPLMWDPSKVSWTGAVTTDTIPTIPMTPTEPPEDDSQD
jgi:hypothetical protein